MSVTDVRATVQPIVDRRIGFGELAGPLVHGSSFFDWQVVAGQEVVAAVDYSFEDLIADGAIPHAPVAVDASVERYPGLGDAITVEAAPLAVGDASVEVLYEFTDRAGERLATIRTTHVTISPDGTALALPDRVRSAFADDRIDRDPSVGPATGESGPDGPGTDAGAATDGATFSASFEIRSPHVEGVEWAYFEEYPRFAAVALEEHLEARGTSLSELQGEKRPYHIRDWHWEFLAPVELESTLHVDCDVLAATEETLRIAHEFTVDGRTCIEGTTEYGCFDRTGAAVSFDDRMLAPFEG